MIRFFKKIYRDFLTFSKAEQYGIIVLLVLTVISGVVYFTLPWLIKPHTYYDLGKIDSIRNFLKEQKHLEDSVNIERIRSSGQLSEVLARQKLHPFPFDPNKLPVDQWKKLGLSAKQIEVIKNYEAKGGKFYVKEDLKKIYCISEAEYEILEPYITVKPLFADANPGIIKRKIKTKYKLTELNSADSSTLVKNLDIPSWMSARIIKYRNKLGGFYSNKQLLEVYGMREKYYNPIKKYIYADTSLMQKICINQVGFKQLLRHPYFDYKTVKLIFNEREKKGKFSNLNQVLNLITDESLKKRLSHYLYICPSDARDY